jgi:DNA polymerase
MARQQLGNHLSVSLDNVRQHYGMPVKRTPYHLFKGKHWHEMSPDVQREVAGGCCDEVESIWTLFNIMAKDFPAEMYPWVDNTVRMFTEPRLVGDIKMLGEVWMDETNNKRNLLERLGVTAQQLGSDDVFADMLRAIGVEPEQKAMKDAADGSPRSKYAFAKTDPFMQELVDDPDDNARALAEARLSVKSTLQQTRSERLGYMASRGSLCVYLSAFGAHTNRDSGGDKLNFQNFTRGSKLRTAIKPPRGWLAAKVDKAQIECRVLNMFAGQWDVVEKFRNKEDPYVGIASQFYGRTITKNDSAERGVGKQLELSCGYGAGAATIIATARKGTYGPPVYLADEEGERAKNLYRDTHEAVTDLWKDAGRMISAIGGTNQPVQWGCVEVHTGQIIGPNGTRLRYPELAYDNEAREWRYKTRRGTTKLYGGKLVENLIQWLAWIGFQQDICRIGKESGYWPVVREHDAGTWLIPDDQYAEQTLAYFCAEMSRPPAWMPDIPLDAEGSLSEREV